MDQMGEVEYAPGEPKGTPWHPHRGFETVTYIIDGVFDHQDSHGGGGSITNGDTQWMTAGSGLLHIETPPEWLVASGRPVPRHPALGEPAARRRSGTRPRYQDIRSGQVGLATTADAGALVRVIAGDVGGHEGPRLDVHPDGDGARHRRARRPPRPAVGGRSTTRSSTCSPAQGTVGDEGRPVRTGNLAVLGAGDFVTVQRRRQPGQPYAGARRARPRRPADPRAGRLGRAVRDEHQGRGA